MPNSKSTSKNRPRAGTLIPRQPRPPFGRISRTAGSNVKVDSDLRTAGSLATPAAEDLSLSHEPNRAGVPTSNAQPNDGEVDVDARMMEIIHAAAGEVKFPRCDAAVRKMEGGEWELADAILAECSETGKDGVPNGSYAKMEDMRQEIATNHGVELSFERIRKLRKVASAFPSGRRRPAVSLEGHLEAGRPEELDALISSVPKGTPLTREYIRRLKNPAEEAERDQQKAERRRQIKDQRAALQNVCRQLEREKEEREQRYTDLCRSIGREPEPFSPPPSPEAEPSLTVAADLEQGLRVLLMARGFDPKADDVKRAIEEFVRAVVVQQE
jgi:hypothetical protein